MTVSRWAGGGGGGAGAGQTSGSWRGEVGGAQVVHLGVWTVWTEPVYRDIDYSQYNDSIVSNDGDLNSVAAVSFSQLAWRSRGDGAEFTKHTQ